MPHNHCPAVSLHLVKGKVGYMHVLRVKVGFINTMERKEEWLEVTLVGHGLA